MANAINYASVFNQVLDEIFYISPKTNQLENTMAGLKWNGGRNIEIPKLSTQGLGNMNGYKAPNGDITFGYETKQLQWYRGRNLTIGRYDIDETNFTLTAGNALKVFLNAHVFPEVDKLRLSEAVKSAYDAGNVGYSAPSSSDIVGKILDDVATIQDKIGEDEPLMIFLSTASKNLVMKSSEISRYLAVRDLTIRGVNMKVDTLNDIPLIGVPASYLKSIFALNDGVSSGETGGDLVAEPYAESVNWVIIARSAFDAVARPQVTKVITPDENQDGEYWKIMFSLYHGAWAFDNKLDGLFANINSTAGLGTLYVTSADATEAGCTKLTTASVDGGSAMAIPAGYALYAKSASDTAPSVTQGTALDSTWTKLSGSDGAVFASTNGHKVQVVLVAEGSLKPVANGSATVVIA